MVWAWTLKVSEKSTLSGADAKAAHPSNTNNVAEYFALGVGLKSVLELMDFGEPSELLVRGDSQLVVKQMLGEWQCKKEHLQALATKCQAVIEKIESYKCKVKLEWIPRELNAEADAVGKKKYEQFTGKPCPERIKR